MESFVIASDFHGDRHDALAYKGFKLFVRDYQPKIKGFAGDLFDFRALRASAGEEEKRHSMTADFEAGMGFLEWYQPDFITLGNHDQRLYDAVEKDGLHKSGPIADYAATLIEKFEKLTSKIRTLVLPYDKRKGVWKYGGLKVVHGFDKMKPEAMAAVYGNVLYGHGHNITQAASPSEETRVARMVGCLCRKDMTYNRAQLGTLRQQHGWAYGAFLGSGRFGVVQAEMIDGQFSYAEKLKTVRVI